MSNSHPEWLPALMTLAEYSGNFPTYLEAVYQAFRADFVNSFPTYPAKRFALKRHPMSDGKEATFWHLVSSGPNEEERLPDLRRTERIRWPRPIIESLGSDRIHSWKNRRGNQERLVIAIDDFSYVVILEDRTDYVLLWTAYFVEETHRREKLAREYRASKESSGNG